MSEPPTIERSALEAEEQDKTQEVARLAQTAEALERRLDRVREELAQAVGGLTTLRRILGLPMLGHPPEGANGNGPEDEQPS
jgi:hypothetical protein